MPPKKTTGKAGARGAGGARAAARAGARGARGARPRGGAPQEPVSPFQPGFAPECLACPFGLFFFTLRQTRPEVMEHLMKAGYELFGAFKGIVDQAAERWEKAQTLQRIPIE